MPALARDFSPARASEKSFDAPYCRADNVDGMTSLEEPRKRKLSYKLANITDDHDDKATKKKPRLIEKANLAAVGKGGRDKASSALAVATTPDDNSLFWLVEARFIFSQLLFPTHTQSREFHPTPPTVSGRAAASFRAYMIFVKFRVSPAISGI